MVSYVTRYISPRSRPLTDGEKVIRQVAYDLKVPTPAAIGFAAPLMAELLEREPCWLIPIATARKHFASNYRLTGEFLKLVCAQHGHVVNGVQVPCGNTRT